MTRYTIKFVDGKTLNCKDYQQAQKEATRYNKVDKVCKVVIKTTN